MPSVAEQLMTVDEFLAWEREQPERHEFADGVIRMMTGASSAHVKIGLNLAFALRQALRSTGCTPYGSDMKIIARGAIRYPDVTVTCRPVGDRDDVAPEPVVVFEIISPSTEHLDKGRKKLDYFGTPSIRQYVIVEQDERLVDLYTRTEAGWINEIVTGTAVLTLSSLGIEIALDAIYEDTELDPTRRPADEAPVPAA